MPLNRSQLLNLPVFAVALALGLAVLAGCQDQAPPLQMVVSDLDRPENPITAAGPITISAARNEWTNFCLQIDGLAASSVDKPVKLRLAALTPAAGGPIPMSNLSAYWVVPVAIATAQASLVRQSGPTIAPSNWPAALVPIPLSDGFAELRPPRTLFSSGNPAGAQASSDWVWIDLHVPAMARAGTYHLACQLIRGDETDRSLAIDLTIRDFSLDDQPGVVMSGRLNWADLSRLYPDRFGSLSPAWLSRTEPRYADAVAVLDEMESIARENRLQVVVPRLQPLAKWSPGQAAQLDWSAFDNLAKPWLDGGQTSTTYPVRCWPVPMIDNLDRFDAASQRDYLSAALRHFDQAQWLDNAVVDSSSAALSGRSGSAAASDTDRSRAIAAILGANPRARVLTSIDEQQLLVRSSDDASLLDRDNFGRMITMSPGLIGPRDEFAPIGPATTSSAAIEDALPTTRHWLSADGESASSASDARLWGALAYLRGAGLIQFDHCLPATNDPETPADPDALPWFYPGSWFGVDHPVASIRLKWLRQAEEDNEYLVMTQRRGDAPTAQSLARLLARPVELEKDQPPDPTYRLLCGTLDSAAWDQARNFLAGDIEIHAPGHGRSTSIDVALDAMLTRWRGARERPYLIARSVHWRPGPNDEFDADIGLDVYNAADALTGNNTLQGISGPRAWQLAPRPLTLGPLDAYSVRRFDLTARVSPADIPAVLAAPEDPITVAFTNGYTLVHTASSLVIPVAHCDRRSASPRIDGQLEDWNMADAIQNGPLVRLLDRSTVQSGNLPLAAHISQICTNWTDDEFLVAFKLGGVSAAADQPIRNFVQYQDRRAWGEDLCQVLVQAQWPDGSTSAPMHLVAKPGGAVWVERQPSGTSGDAPWIDIQSAVKYAATLHQGDWRGELAIPWSLLRQGHADIPIALRFNFVQHIGQTGESDSWAGPIDFGRDDQFMGLLILRNAPTVPALNPAN
jgi:hypothetical protein